MFREFLIIAVIFMAVSPARALQVTFLTEGSVTAPVVTLGDIVHFSDDGPVAVALGSKPVGQAPPPGETVLLDSVKIGKYLQATEHLPEDLSWNGANVVNVTRQGINITPARIQEIIANFLEQNKARLPKATIQFLPATLPMPFFLPMGAMSYQVIPSDPAILGSSRFAIIFKVDDKVVKNMSVRGRVEAIGKVVVASQPLRKGTILQPDQLRLKEMDLGELQSAGTDPHDFIGKLLTRSLPGGSPVLASMVETLPVIRKGEKVRIVIDTGPLQLSATGLSHNDGKIGDMIQVQNINSNKLIYCRVAAPGLVEVLL
jgi:flagella basal body P-ring formation protein FlgA